MSRLLAADFSQLGQEVEKIKGADMLHIDIMDGHFVPNLSMGPALVEALRGKTPLHFDVHLMLTHPLEYVQAFRDAGADSITFHVECGDQPETVIQKILDSGAQAGVAIKPDTPAEAVGPWGERLQFCTIMTVHPGFGGQKMIPQALEKISQLKARFPQLQIEVDGGVNPDTAPLCAKAGADILIAGTAVFRAQDPEGEMQRLRAAK